MNDTGIRGSVMITLGVIIIALLIVGWTSIQPSFGSAPAGLPATVASTSNPTLTAATAVGIFATSTTCTARVVTTGASAIMLTFTDRVGQTPTGSFGHLQAASTTQVYDSGLYGCGFVKAVSYATQLVTISDVR